MRTSIQFYVDVCEDADDLSGLLNLDTTTTSVFRDPQFITVLVISVFLLLLVFVILALIRFRQIRVSLDSELLIRDLSLDGKKFLRPVPFRTNVTCKFITVRIFF